MNSAQSSKSNVKSGIPALLAEIQKLKDQNKVLQDTIDREKLEQDIGIQAMKDAKDFIDKFKGFPPSAIPLLIEVGQERVRQEAKWGEQNHPDGTGGEDYVKMADRAKAICESAFKNKTGTYKHILAEEVAEAFAESDEPKLMGELVQVAAVAVAWIECILRRIAKRDANAQTQ